MEKPSNQEMILSFDSMIILTCKKTTNYQSYLDNAFSLVPALEEGYFSDMELHAANNHTVKIRAINFLSYLIVLQIYIYFSFKFIAPFSLSANQTLIGNP